MIRYIIRRVLWAVLVLLIVVFITYMIFFLLPSTDPAVPQRPVISSRFDTDIVQ